ncbi:MAG: rRNA maturation RNase YbeY [Candidatus Curtissbacteria bacterium]|nr:rRNA maturation RNase YbeY [Candidatus Curtissbacteria bacterium]
MIRTDTRYPVNRKAIRKAVFDTFLKHGIVSSCEVSVFIVGERKMKELSEKYYGDSDLHEVFSFPLEDSESSSENRGFVNSPDDKLRLGDIVLCWPQVVMLAGQEGIMVDEEISFLTAHAAEHLLGIHHE